MKTLVLLSLTCLLSFTAFAAEEAEEAPTSAPTRLPIEVQYNYFGVRLLNVSGLSLTYAYRIDSQWLIGASVTSARYQLGNDRSGSGDLNAGTYYAEDAKVSLQTLEINSTYFFREDGYKRFGFLARGGIGMAQGSMTGKFYRYDTDPAVFQLGDGKRLQETGPEVRNDYQSPYARLGGYYQFAWTPRKGTSIGGHILEVGLSLTAMQNPPSLNVTRTNGTIRTFDSERTLLAAEVSYTFVF